MTFGAVLNNVLAMEATEQLESMSVDKKEDENDNTSAQRNCEDEEEVASELVGR